MDIIYDRIGQGYTRGRQTDPTIFVEFSKHLSSAESILNIGAGTGNYEPNNQNLIAIEPSQEMIRQRPAGSHISVQACAEYLPFADNSFSHSMTVLSMHHWQNRARAFGEIKRVTSKCFVALTWDPESKPYWLTSDYLPEIYSIDARIFPKINELNSVFNSVKIYPLAIPVNCIDGFTAAFWARPHAYLNNEITNGMSTFSKLNEAERGLEKLKRDLESGAWERKYGHLKKQPSLDVGYKIVVCNTED